MKKLKLTNNPIEDAGVRFLAECAEKIEKLEIASCDFSEREVKKLAENIKNGSMVRSCRFFIILIFYDIAFDNNQTIFAFDLNFTSFNKF